MSTELDVEKLIDGLNDAAPAKQHPVDAILDDLVEQEGDAYKRVLWALENADSVSAPSLANALNSAGGDVKPSQINSWRRREGIRITPKGAQ